MLDINHFTAALLDMDGVLYRGSEPLPGVMIDASSSQDPKLRTPPDTAGWTCATPPLDGVGTVDFKWPYACPRPFP